MTNKIPKSNCCQAEVRLNNEDGGVTRFYICTKCNKSCDLEILNKKIEEVLRKFDDKFFTSDDMGCERIMIDYQELKQFIKSSIEKSVKEIEIEIDTEISKLLHKLANTPLGQRKTPRYWLIKLRNIITKRK